MRSPWKKIPDQAWGCHGVIKNFSFYSPGVGGMSSDWLPLAHAYSLLHSSVQGCSSLPDSFIPG
jgi:hypothetical protein